MKKQWVCVHPGLFYQAMKGQKAGMIAHHVVFEFTFHEEHEAWLEIHCMLDAMGVHPDVGASGLCALINEMECQYIISEKCAEKMSARIERDIIKKYGQQRSWLFPKKDLQARSNYALEKYNECLKEMGHESNS